MAENLPILRKLMVSGRLELISGSGPIGEWLHFGGNWYRELNAAAFVWLRARVLAAAESESPPVGLSEAIAALEWIRDTGVFWGSFAESEIGDHRLPDPDWQWFEGCPRWAEFADF